MASAERIRTAVERNQRALTLRPAIGRGTACTRVRLTGALACEIEEGRWRLVADMGEKHGGEDLGPNPGVMGRGALGACLAIGYARWAAVRGIHLRSLEVEVQADYDARGEYATADVTPGYSEIRYLVTVDADASEQEITQLLDEADARSSYLDVFARPQRLVRAVRIASHSR